MSAALKPKEPEKNVHLCSLLYIIKVYAAKSGCQRGWRNLFSSPCDQRAAHGCGGGPAGEGPTPPHPTSTLARGWERPQSGARGKTEVMMIICALLTFPRKFRKFLMNYESHHKCGLLLCFLGQCLAHSKCLVNAH